MEASKVIGTVFKYLEKNMVPGMNELQEVAFYTIEETVFEETEKIIEAVTDHPFTRVLISVDKSGNMDVEKLASRLRKAMERKGSVSFNVPFYGPVRFIPEDIDNILRELKEVGYRENYPHIG